MPNYFCAEYQLAELETGEDVEIVFKEENLLESDLDKETFKRALEAIERHDLNIKLEIYVAAGK